MSETSNALEHCADLATLEWTLDALRWLDPGTEAAHRMAYNVLIHPRRGWLKALGDDVVLKLGELAFARYMETQSASLSDYADIGEELQPVLRFAA